MRVSGEKLRELREERAYSLRELERLSGVTYNTIHRLETGHHEDALPRTVRRLAEALGVRPSELRL